MNETNEEELNKFYALIAKDITPQALAGIIANCVLLLNKQNLDAGQSEDELFSIFDALLKRDPASFCNGLWEMNFLEDLQSRLEKA